MATTVRGGMQISQNEMDTAGKRETNSHAYLYDYFNVVHPYRKTIGCIVGGVFALSLIISLLLPKSYVATTIVLPPQEPNVGIASLLGFADNQVGGLAASLVGQHPPAALYVGILKSRSVADALNEKFDLKNLYDLDYIEDVYLELEERATIEISKKDQLVIVSVRDRDPQRAADMANAYVDKLDQINRRLIITEGKRKRLFLEDRLKEVRADLEKAEMELKAFQEKHHLVSIEEQAKAAIEGAAEIKGQIIASQTELEVLRQFGTEKQREAVMLNARIKELQNQLAAIEKGKKAGNDAADSYASAQPSDFYLSFEDLPRLGLQLMRLTREAKLQEKLYELITAQYEIARIEEAKDVDIVQVLDRAVPPEKKHSPKRTRIVLVSTFLAFIGSILAVFVKHYHRRFSL